MESPMAETPDRKRVQEFARKLFGHYTSGMLTMMVDIGHKTGLFEAIAKGPDTSPRIADRAGLDERYVREWLGAMVTGGIIQYDPGSETFARTRGSALARPHQCAVRGGRRDAPSGRAEVRPDHVVRRHSRPARPGGRVARGRPGARA